MLLHILISNAVSTLIDSAVFITIVFLGVMLVLPLIVGQFAVKMAGPGGSWIVDDEASDSEWYPGQAGRRRVIARP